MQNEGEKDFETINETMRRYKIVTPERRVYYLVDFPVTGGTFELISRAIKTVLPSAQIRLAGYSKREPTSRSGGKNQQSIRLGISTAEDVPRPTHQMRRGRILPRKKGTKERNDYLEFQYNLQAFLEQEIARRKND